MPEWMISIAMHFSASSANLTCFENLNSNRNFFEIITLFLKEHSAMTEITFINFQFKFI